MLCSAVWFWQGAVCLKHYGNGPMLAWSSKIKSFNTQELNNLGRTWHAGLGTDGRQFSPTGRFSFYFRYSATLRMFGYVVAVNLVVPLMT